MEKVAKKYIVHPMHHPQYLNQHYSWYFIDATKVLQNLSIAVDAAGTQNPNSVQDIAATNTAREQWLHR